MLGFLTQMELNSLQRYQLEIAAGAFGYAAHPDDTDADLRLVIVMGLHEEIHKKMQGTSEEGRRS